MRRLVPDSVAGRIVLVMLVGLTLSHLASVALYYNEGTEALTLADDQRIAERIALITRLVEETPKAERERVVQAVEGRDLRVTWSETNPGREGMAANKHLQSMAQMLIAHLGDRGEGGVHVGLAQGAVDEGARGVGPAAMPMSGGHSEAMRRHMEAVMEGSAADGGLWASVRLSDSSWLSFTAPLNATTPFSSLRFILSMAIMVLAVLALSVWVVRRTTAPLEVFARAAERLGVDVNAPALPESGPREVRQATRAFNQMQRRIGRFVEDRTQMVAAIAHDLRTPITRLRLNAEFLEQEDQQRKMLADLDEMEQMIASILRFVKEDAASEPRETVDLVSLIQSVCDDLADAGRAVAFEGDGRLSYQCRRIALRRAFGNLIENAVKYGERARVLLEFDDGAVTVHVDDDGPGIPRELHADVFKPFRRLEGSRSRDTGGTGLGLTVARTIVRAHGGDIVLANRAQGGLRATVTLPRRADGDVGAGG